MLKDYVPSFLCNGKIFKKLYENQQNEIDDINLDVDDLVAQCFVSTATWGLIYWESELGIITNTQKSYTERRNKILGKLRGQGTATVQAIKNIAQVYAETVNVIEYNSDYYFEVDLETHSGFSNFLDEFTETIEEFKPAHLGVKYKLKSIKNYESKSYIASTLVSSKYYQLSSDFNINYSSENSSKIASNIVNTNNYVLTNNIDSNFDLNANLVQASIQVNTSKYELS